MLRHILLVAFCFLAVTVRARAMQVSGYIDSDHTWSGAIHVTGDCIIRNGTLTIQSGTQITFASTNDNPQYGDSSRIWFVVADSGAVDARGYAGAPIRFTAAAAKPGSWGGIRFMGLKNDAGNYLIHCEIAYAVDGVSVENQQGVSEPSSPSISYCIISDCSRYGLYGNIGAAPRIQSCVIRDAGTGVFLHEAGNVVISETYLYNLGSGVVLNGGSGAYPYVNLDHVTFNNISSAYDSLPLWWRGYAIYCTNTSGSISLTNSIMAGAEYGIKLNNWDFEGSCNYWCVGERPLPESLYDIGSMSCGYQGDPFVDSDGGDLRLEFGVRPRNAACSGGSNMGAWQEWHDWPYEPVVSVLGEVPSVAMDGAPAFSAAPNPSRGATVFSLPARAAGTVTVHDRQGRTVRVLRVSGTDTFRWDGRNTDGRSVAPGLYICRLRTGGAEYETSVIVVR